MTVSTCKRCLYRDDHPLGLVIDEEGICSGCRVHEEKDFLDWGQRWLELENLVSDYKSRDSRNYDCIVPVTGGNDSYYIVHTVVNRLKLKPLLVSNNRYYNTEAGIKNLANLRIQFNADILIQNVNPNSVKSIIRTTLRRLGSIHWPAIAGQTAFPVQVAVSHKIPLIIWGAHQGLEQVGMFSHLHNVEMSRRYRKDHDLMGLEADDLLSIFDNLTEADIWQYRYPSFDNIASIGIRGIYLGNYIRWDPLDQHKQMVKLYGYKGTKLNRTFDQYDHVDDWHYTDTHDFLKYSKVGYGKVVDQICREIRHGRIDKHTGINLANYYQNQSTINHDLLFNWLNISRDAFEFAVSNFTYSSPFKENSDIIDPIQPDPLNKAAHSFIEANYPSNSNFNSKVNKQITIGKGYP